jgi:signal transduction histidine kinase
MDAWLEKFALANFARGADTAHDLKTPLNVAVLNLELLRMRVAKLAEATGDEKITAYAAAIETELRRMARIFDAFFLMSTPPKGEGDPTMMDVMPLLDEAARAASLEVPSPSPALVRAHPSRIRQAFKLFFEGASKFIEADGREIAVERSDDHVDILMTGRLTASDLELTKIFKFYYTDPLGNPDLSLATARLVVETYGGQLNAMQERDTVILRLSLPLGDR